MAKKKLESDKSEVELDYYEIRNLKQATFPIPFYNENGQQEYLTLLLQGRKGQTPPVVASTAITAGMREMEKNGFIRLVKVLKK